MARPTATTKRGDRILVSFDHAGRGLQCRGDRLLGFAICGEDRTFVVAEAEIVGLDRVSVRSDRVSRPTAVRFGWADYPAVNLWNSDGLPASPFRTDSFPGLTQPKLSHLDRRQMGGLCKNSGLRKVV